MTSRERVVAAVNFKEPDRVPIDLGGTTGASGIHVLAYNNLRKYYGLTYGSVKCNDIMQQLAVIESDVIERIGIDVFQVSPVLCCESWTSYKLYENLTVELPGNPNIVYTGEEWRLTDLQGQIYIKPNSSFYFDAEDGVSWYSYPFQLTDEFLSLLEKKVKHIYEATDLAIAAKIGAAFGNMANPEFLMELITEPAKVEDTLSLQCEKAIEELNLFLQAIGKYIFCITAASDLGSQNAPLISTDMFRSMLMPHYKRYTSWLHKHYPQIKYYLHSCGAIEPLIESFIEMGVDILNPVQTSAEGMEPEKLIKKYHGRIVFWGGGCDTQNVLGKRDIDTLIEHVKERIKIFAPGGGFVFNQIHAIQPDVPPEHITAMFDTVKEYGRYPIYK